MKSSSFHTARFWNLVHFGRVPFTSLTPASACSCLGEILSNLHAQDLSKLNAPLIKAVHVPNLGAGRATWTPWIRWTSERIEWTNELWHFMIEHIEHFVEKSKPLAATMMTGANLRRSYGPDPTLHCCSVLIKWQQQAQVVPRALLVHCSNFASAFPWNHSVFTRAMSDCYEAELRIANRQQQRVGGSIACEDFVPGTDSSCMVACTCAHVHVSGKMLHGTCLRRIVWSFDESCSICLQSSMIDEGSLHDTWDVMNMPTTFALKQKMCMFRNVL
jgi:hypothetical protein